jgi:protein farnesyltransferase subunit beta
LVGKSHANYSAKGLNGVSRGYQSLDASRPWMVYWILHSLELLDALPDTDTQHRVVEFLGRCQNASGGFGGGPGQLSHLAPTYASINALSIIGTKEAFAVPDRAAMHSWLLSLKDPITGGFRMHHDGELDVRGTYCAMSVARILRATAFFF